MTPPELPESVRKDIFLALVKAQDQAAPVAESRKFVAEWYGVTEDQVRTIECEGVERNWPPL